MDLNCNRLNCNRLNWDQNRRASSGAPSSEGSNELGAPPYSPQGSVRWDRVRELRRQIAAGTYETEAKWVETLARLRQALGG
ncbi:MAG TPA: hypothetical protein DEA08_04320 [Planctomycetes bacterium]|nr:hypothetical protein [Planctomycetota bacterium]